MHVPGTATPTCSSRAVAEDSFVQVSVLHQKKNLFVIVIILEMCLPPLHTAVLGNIFKRK